MRRIDGRGKTSAYAEAQIRRAGFGFGQQFSRSVAKPRPAPRAAAVDAQNQETAIHRSASINGVQIDLPKVRTKWTPNGLVWGLSGFFRRLLRPMETERASPRYSDIDLWEPGDILHALIEGQMAAVAAVRPALGAIERAAAAMEARLRGDGRLIYVGAGTSGRLAVQDGAELIPTFNWPQDRLLLLIAGGKHALLRTAEGAEDEIERAARLIQHHRIGTADVIIAVAASGTTPFTLACMREGKRRGALAIGIANNTATPLLDEADCPIWLDTGPEPIAGSTRMKAGTAQRVALNLLSTLVMIRLGRVHEGLMVDMQAVNAKLVERSANILRRLSGRSGAEVNDALARGGNIKIAMLLLHGCGNAQAESLLKQAGGRLRTALRLAGVRPAVPSDMLTVGAEDASAVPDKVGEKRRPSTLKKSG
jgi:N-acetylmuramic acid 6-phosphate etherase